MSLYDECEAAYNSSCGKSVKACVDGDTIPADFSALPFCPKCGAEMTREAER